MPFQEFLDSKVVGVYSDDGSSGAQISWTDASGNVFTFLGVSDNSPPGFNGMMMIAVHAYMTGKKVDITLDSTDSHVIQVVAR